MKKKVLSLVLVAAMAASMVACGSNDAATNDANATAPETQAATNDAPAADAEEEIDYGSGEITIWVADAVTDLTKQLADQFIADGGYNYTVTVEAVGEGDAAGNMITDVEGGADIYGFAQDQIARLVSAGALQQLTGTG